MTDIALSIQIDGEELESDWLGRKGTVGRVYIKKALNQHSWCEIEFRQTAESRPVIEKWIGRGISLRSTAGTKLFTGFVLDVCLKYESSGSFQVLIKSVDQSYKLDLAPRHCYYGPVSLSELAQQIGARATLKITVTQGGGTKAPLDLVQWGETDWHFLWRLCDDLGLYLIAADDGIHIAQGFTQDGPELQWRSDQDTGIVEFSIGGSISAPSTDGSHYDFSSSKSEVFQQVTKDAAWSGAAPNFTSAVAQQSKATLQPGYKTWRNRSKTLDDYRASLEQESEWSLGSGLFCEGVSRCESLAPGQSVQISGLEGGSGKYNITAVVHTWEPLGYTNLFSCTSWMGWRSNPHPALPQVTGVYSARVINIDDPHGQGQVQVQYYWQEQGQTTWIRHLTPYAGADRGIFFRPEVGDEVMIAFEEGDPERPVILGSAWNMSDVIPNEDFWGGETHNNDVKRIVTKSGHRISLIDKAGAESIAIATPTHAKLVLHEKFDETGRPAIIMNVDHGDLIFNAPNGRIHFHSKYWSREVGE